MRKSKSFIAVVVIMMLVCMTGCKKSKPVDENTVPCIVEGCTGRAAEGQYCPEHAMPSDALEISFELKNETGETYIIHYQSHHVDDEYKAVTVDKSVTYASFETVGAGQTRTLKERLRVDNDYSSYEAANQNIPEFTVDKETGKITGRVVATAGLMFLKDGQFVQNPEDYYSQILDISYQYQYPKTMEEAKSLKQKITIAWDGKEFRQAQE